jgi:hypothetical protein
MSALEKIQNRAVLVAAVIGLAVGCLFGWLAIGWGIWPVQYVGEAYTYELSSTDKMHYVAALSDSYSLRRQIDSVRQRLAGWSPADKVSTLAELYAMYELQGAAVEAKQIVLLATDLKQTEGWEANAVDAVLRDLAAQYVNAGNREHAQFISLFASEIGLVAVAPGEEGAPAPAAAPPAQAQPATGGIGALVPILLALLLVVLFALVVLFLMRRRQSTATSRRAARTEMREWIEEEGGGALLTMRSTYRLGMDSFDESFSIEQDGAFKGECGVGISEAMGEDTPRKVMAFEVWLFDKSDIRTITKVLLSEYAYNNEVLRNKLSARGEAILAQPGATIVLETAALEVEATVAEMDYGPGELEASFFNTLSVALVARTKPSTPAPAPAAPEPASDPAAAE